MPVNEGAPCDDGSVCTTLDLCSDGECEGAGVIDCEDDNLCSDDYCHPTAGCQHSVAPNGTPCGEAGWVCLLGQCLLCDPDCQGKECGDDGCGGSCGECGEGTVCVLGDCMG